MASVNLDPLNPPLTYDRDQVRVLAKKSWAGQWVPVAYMVPISATRCAAPSVSKAAFRYDAGTIKREDQTAFAYYPPQALLDHFVRVERLGDAFGGPQGDAIPLWTGIVAEDARVTGGHDTGGGELVDQHLVAYGLEHLLDRHDINSSWCTNGGEGRIQVDRCLVFNERYDRGFTERGNRSVAKVDGSHVFAGPAPGDEGDNQQWSVRDIVEYLLANFAAGGVTWKLAGDEKVLQCLAKTVYPRVDLSGDTVKRALDRLLDRRSGLGWHVRPGQEGGPAEVFAFSTLDEDVKVDDGILPGNGDVVTIALDDFRQLVDDVEHRRDAADRYGKVVVLGGAVVACCSFSFTDGTLKEGWEEDEQSAYINAGSGPPGEAEAGPDKVDDAARDRERKADRHLRVFTHYVVEGESGADWNGQAGDGEGGPKTVAVPAVNKEKGDLAETVGPMRNWGWRFLRTIPLPKSKPVSDDLGYEPEYRQMMAFVQGPKANDGTEPWLFVDNAGDDVAPIASLRPLDTAFGVAVEANPAHLLAKGYFRTEEFSESDDGKSATAPLYDYRKLVVTAAFETDQRLRVEVDVPGGLPGRVLTIEQPDLQLWHVAAGAVVDVVAGKLVRHGAKTTVRDDSARARQIAALARAWYGKRRSPLSFRAAYLAAGAEVGQYVKSARSAAGEFAVDSVLTQVMFDFQAGDTTVSTDYEEIDFTMGGRRRRRGGTR